MTAASGCMTRCGLFCRREAGGLLMQMAGQLARIGPRTPSGAEPARRAARVLCSKKGALKVNIANARRRDCRNILACRASPGQGQLARDDGGSSFARGQGGSGAGSVGNNPRRARPAQAQACRYTACVCVYSYTP